MKIGRVPIGNVLLSLMCAVLAAIELINHRWVNGVLLLGVANLLVDVYISR